MTGWLKQELDAASANVAAWPDGMARRNELPMTEQDIVDRLRQTGGERGFPYTAMREAADEIQTLRTTLTGKDEETERLREHASLLVNLFVNPDEHGGDAYDDDCDICRAVAAVRKANQ